MKLRISSIAGAYYDYLQFVDQVVFGVNKQATPKMLLGTAVDVLIKNNLFERFNYPWSRMAPDVAITREAVDIANYYFDSPLYQGLISGIGEILNIDERLDFDFHGVPLLGHPDLFYRGHDGEIHVLDFKTSANLKPGWSNRYLSRKLKTKEPTKTLVDSNFGWAVQLHCYGFPYQATHHHIVALSSKSVTEYDWSIVDPRETEPIETFVKDLWQRLSPGGHLYPNLSPEESEDLRRLKCSLHQK